MATMNVLDAAGGTVAVEKPLAPGQANMAGSRPVVIASDQSVIAVSASSLPLPTGAATSANQTTLNALFPASLGTKTAANSFSITLASDLFGATADAAAANGAAGTAMAYWRAIKDAATSTASSSVTIDQTTPGTTNAFSLAQIGSTAVAAGAGVVGAGVRRVTQASDSPLVTAFGTAGTAKTYTGTFTVAGTALTRPANTTAYSIGDSISNNGTAASVTTTAVALSDTNDHPIDLAEILLDSTDTGPGTAGATIRLHLYNADYTASTGVQAGDNAARSQKKNGWVGSFSGTMQAFFDGSKGRLVADTGNLLMAVPVSGAKTFYWELEARTAFTPSANSTTFTPTFKGFQGRPA